VVKLLLAAAGSDPLTVWPPGPKAAQCPRPLSRTHEDQLTSSHYLPPMVSTRSRAVTVKTPR
jgi:hypothetical protein